jgi:predicted  nucleic acid-binding Zn-ribbon protein
MRMTKWFLGGVSLILAAFGVSMAAQTARPPQDADVLSALLVEVRGLRQAMEQIGTSGARVQLSLGRLQLQEQRVNNTIRRLESVRDSRAQAEKDYASTLGQVATFENMFKGEKEVPADNPLGAMLANFKKAVAASEAEIQRLQQEEALIEQQISLEQGRWSEINRALEELERAFSKR